MFCCAKLNLLYLNNRCCHHSFHHSQTINKPVFIFVSCHADRVTTTLWPILRKFMTIAQNDTVWIINWWITTFVFGNNIKTILENVVQLADHQKRIYSSAQHDSHDCFWSGLSSLMGQFPNDTQKIADKVAKSSQSRVSPRFIPSINFIPLNFVTMRTEKKLV